MRCDKCKDVVAEYGRVLEDAFQWELKLCRACRKTLNASREIVLLQGRCLNCSRVASYGMKGDCLLSVRVLCSEKDHAPPAEVPRRLALDLCCESAEHLWRALLGAGEM